MTIQLTQVDAFTDRPFSGNPAAVCLLDEPASPTWMQSIAAEMNLSETAFLVAVDGGWHLRWFTPTVEVDLCGHATLAAAHVLFTEHHHREPLARFLTRSGWLSAARLPDGWIELDLPRDEPRPADPPTTLVDALRLDPANVVATAQGRFDWMVVVDHVDVVRGCSPDHGALASIGTRGVSVTARRADAPQDLDAPDIESRFFAPGSGIDEDPVTGSAHCLLGPYWAAVLGRDRLVARQVSPRGGTLRLEVRHDRVAVAGRAVTTLTATLSPAAEPTEGDAA